METYLIIYKFATALKSLTICGEYNKNNDDDDMTEAGDDEPTDGFHTL